MQTGRGVFSRTDRASTLRIFGGKRRPRNANAGKVRCFITGEWRNSTPEEKVRQQFGRSLVEEFGYRKSELEFEFPITIGSSQRRADIVVFEPGALHQQRNVVIVIEVKRHDRPANDIRAQDQLFSYMSACPACRYGLLLAQKRSAYKRNMSDGKIESVKSIPKYGRDSLPARNNSEQMESSANPRPSLPASVPTIEVQPSGSSGRSGRRLGILGAATLLAAAGILAFIIGSCNDGIPGVVQDLQLVNATEDSISLAWDPPENADAVTVDRYEVIREVPRLPDHGFSVSEAAFTDTGLDPETEYRYRVRAVSVDGEEGAEIDFFASTYAAVPDPPGSVLALRMVNATEDSISLAWDPPANADAVTVDRYEVIREVPRLPDKSFSVAEAAFTDTGLDPETEYRYRVRAVSIDGVEGAEVDLVASTAVAPVEPPGSVLALRLVNATEDSLSLAWDPPANADAVTVDRYEVIREVPRLPDESFSVAEAAFTDAQLQSDSQYRYRVRAISVDGIEGPTVDLAASTLKTASELESITPGAVRNLRAESTQNSIVLAWDPPANAEAVPIDRYKVSRSIALRPDEVFFVSELEFTDKGLTAGTEYRYRVNAIGLNGEMGAEIDLVASTSESTGNSESEIPDPVRNLTASSVSNNSITISWDPPENAEAASVIRYEVARDVRFRPDERFSVAETSFTDSGLDSDSQYRYRVRAINRSGTAGQAIDLIAKTLAG